MQGFYADAHRSMTMIPQLALLLYYCCSTTRTNFINATFLRWRASVNGEDFKAELLYCHCCSCMYQVEHEKACMTIQEPPT